MKTLVYCLLFITNVLALDFDLIPDDFHAGNIKASFGLSSSIKGGKSTLVTFTTGTNISSKDALDYYKKYFNSEWTICEDQVNKHNQWFLDYSGNKYELKETRIGFNSQRLLTTGFQIGESVKTKQTHIFIIQYHYLDDKQFNREYNTMCK